MKRASSSLEGQLSLWDVEITQKPSLFTKTGEKVTKNDVSFTISPKEVITVENDKIKKSLELTVEQQEFLDKNKIYSNENLSRIIFYRSGSMGIELYEGNGFKTIYVNPEGQEEFIKDKKLPVLPMDKIIYYKNELRANEVQEQRLDNLKLQHKYLKEIRRKGDENIIVELMDKVISINSIGWVLEFQGVQVVYEESEVVQVEPVDLKNIQSRAKVGDTIEVAYPDKIFSAEVTHVYGGYNESLCISYEVEGVKKNTAIPRLFIKKILKCA